MRTVSIAILSLSLVGITTSWVHKDIHEVIATLTAEIAKAPTADLYYRRATEHRAHQDTEKALADLRQALELAPENTTYLTALIQLHQYKATALPHIEKYLSIANTPAQKYEATFLLAEHQHYQKQNREALKHTELLQQKHPEHSTALDILHADILKALDRPSDAANILKQSWQRTHSIVIFNQWVDTALTAGQTTEVLPHIEHELENSRLRSSWLIRRARARLILDQKSQAESDLQEALAEINKRLNPNRPDLTLIADRGLIHALLGNQEAAKTDHKLLTKSALPPKTYALFTHTLNPPQK